jgi:hypothetical protein
MSESILFIPGLGILYTDSSESQVATRLLTLQASVLPNHP